MDLLVGSADAWKRDQSRSQPFGDARYHSGTGDALGLHVEDLHGLSRGRVDPAGHHGDQLVVEDHVVPCAVIVDVHIRYGSRGCEHTVLDGLSLHGGSRGGGTGVELPVVQQPHLGVGTVVGDHACLLLVQHAGFDDHRQRIGAYLVPDGRRYEDLGLRIQSQQSYVPGVGHVCLPGRGHDAQILQFVLSRERQVPDLDVLEQRQLDRVSAHGQLGDLRQLVLAVEADEVVYRLDDDLVGDVPAGLHPEVHVVHDVRSGERVSGSDGGVEDLSALVKVDEVRPESACTEVQCDAVCHGRMMQFMDIITAVPERTPPVEKGFRAVPNRCPGGTIRSSPLPR